MNRFFSGLGRSVVRLRYLVVLLWIVAAVISMKALPSMSSEVNNDNSQFLSASAPSARADSLAAPLLGNTAQDSQVDIVASRSAGALTASDQRAISREVAAVRKVPFVLSARQAGISPDGRAAQIIVLARVNSQDIATQKTLVASLEAAFAQAHAPAGLQFHPAGTVAADVAN